ncbi:hypothetical protein [Desulfosporosinus orientis]|uniref:hypothetical protein n=1 Tax=Desulfosporosinus orientis TaxID=1563 RepID=UPI0003080C06|nr:hypothetical protein [Desulfosporosinus orientis]
MHGEAVKPTSGCGECEAMVNIRYCPEVWLRSRSREGASLGMLRFADVAKLPDLGHSPFSSFANASLIPEEAS